MRKMMFPENTLQRNGIFAVIAVLIIGGLTLILPKITSLVNSRQSSSETSVVKNPSPKEGNFISVPVTERTALKGKILKIQGNSLFVETGPAYPGASPSLNEREVAISQSTTLQKEDGLRTDSGYAQELKAFNEKIASLEASGGSTAGLKAPNPYRYEKVDFSAFSVGQYVVIISDKNIADSKVITPNYLLIQNYVASGG
ncbi:MAG: hypothetical protein ACYC1Y_03560 [Minisyncoccota bacterium]